MTALSGTCNAVSNYKADSIAVSRASACLRSTNFKGNTTLLQRTPTTNVVRSRQYVVETQSFKFMKKLGMKKPEFLPDFGKVCSVEERMPAAYIVSQHKICVQDKRLALLNSFFTTNDKATLEGLLSDNAKIVEEGTQPRTYNKTEFVNLLSNHIVPAIPDFSWCHATSGQNDKEGYAVVTCQVSMRIWHCLQPSTFLHKHCP